MNEHRHVLKHVKGNQQYNKTCVLSDSVFNYLSECVFVQNLNIFETILGAIIIVRILYISRTLGYCTEFNFKMVAVPNIQI